MQEFSSVTASSYDADSLTPMLNEKSAEGWNVVSVVSAGTNIVAYLSRDSDGSTVAVDDTVNDDTVNEDMVIDDMVNNDMVSDVVVAGDAVTEAPGEGVAAVEEPAGWAVAPESSESADDSIASLAAEVGAADAAPVLASAEPVAYEPVAEPVVQAPPAAEPTVPAGWYADPSGRYELRYWDGAAWTEHVSRAGQQFTDPPVA